MTGDTFGRLLYTDCRPGAGRGSGGGFQVQAQSRDVDAQQASAAVSWLLYEAQPAWITERRPVEEFPPGFAHASADGYGTAQGQYLGKEAVGGRQGNHLTDCLLTRDPARYGSTRPAQLWRSPLWRAKTWDTTECPPFDGDLEPGPLVLEEIADWVRADSRRGPVLARLLSLLEDPDGQRVAIVSADADEAMRWIAAATLLLPQRRALQLAFKVFSAAPLRARQRVVAAPPELNPDLRPGRDTGMFVVDAAPCTSDEAAVTERAAFLAGKLAGDEDPYDVVDAADLADELCGSAWPQDIGALHAAWLLTVPGATVPDPAAVFRWLQAAGPGPLRGHGPVLAVALLAADASAEVLRWLDGRVAAGELEFDRNAIRTRLLAAEIAGILARQPAPRGALPDVNLSDQARRDAESALTSALLRGSDRDLDLAEVDQLLRLAHRHRVSLEPLSPPVRDVLHRFAVDWIDSGELWDPAGRALADTVLDSAYAELRTRFGRDRSSAAMRAAQDRLAPYFDGHADLTDDLYCYLQAAKLAGLPERERNQRFNELFAAIVKLPRGAAEPAALNVQQALLDRDAIDPVIAIAILSSALGESAVNPEVHRFATRWLSDHMRRPDARLLRVLESLDKLNKVPDSPARLAELATASRKVSQFLATARAGAVTDQRVIAAAVKTIGAATHEVVAIRAAEILDAFIASPDLAGAVYAALPKGDKVARELARQLKQRAGTLDAFADQVTWAVLIARVLGQPNFPEHRFYDLFDPLEIIYGSVSSGRGGARNAEKWNAEVFGRLETEAQRGEWDRCMGHLSRKMRNWL